MKEVIEALKQVSAQFAEREDSEGKEFYQQFQQAIEILEDKQLQSSHQHLIDALPEPDDDQFKAGTAADLQSPAAVRFPVFFKQPSTAPPAPQLTDEWRWAVNGETVYGLVGAERELIEKRGKEAWPRSGRLEHRLVSAWRPADEQGQLQSPNPQQTPSIMITEWDDSERLVSYTQLVELLGEDAELIASYMIAGVDPYLCSSEHEYKQFAISDRSALSEQLKIIQEG